MNARAGDTHLHGAVGVLNNGDAPITIHMPCPGPGACPYRLPPEGDRDAKEENEFFADTGIRAGTRARALLRELKSRHGYLKWRGTGGLSRMWQHKTVEYLDGDNELRIQSSRFAEGYGWFVFLLGGFFETMFVAAITGRTKLADVELAVTALLSLVVGLGAMWLAAEHMISPERAARKLAKKEQRQ